MYAHAAARCQARGRVAVVARALRS